MKNLFNRVSRNLIHHQNNMLNPISSRQVHSQENRKWLDRKTRSYLTVLGTSLIYFAMGLYFAAGNTGVYLTSYLIYRAGSPMKLDDAIWFLSAAGFSALLLPMGGWLESRVGVRGVCMIGGFLQSSGIFATYFALDTTFLIVVIVYGGSFLVSLASCYTSPLVNVCKWHPNHKGLVSGIGAASMAVAPTLFTPLITALVNPKNLPANELGLFDDLDILIRTKNSTLIQGLITSVLFIIGTALTFPAEPINDDIQDNIKKTNRHTEIVHSREKTVEFVAYRDLEECSNLHHMISNQIKSESPENRDESFRAKVISSYIDVSNDTTKTINNGETTFSMSDLSLEPRYAFRTSEFWLLSLKVLISEIIFIYLLFMYKPFGQTFIHDDYFLSSVGAACAISNTFGRLTMGHLKDKFGYKAVSIPLSAITLTFILLMPLTRYLRKMSYGIAIILAVGGVGSQYALMPSAAQDSFGDKYASVNIGFVYMSTVVATVSSALLSQNLTSMIGWNGMIFLMATFSAIDFISTFFMPNDPAARLRKRCEQFYAEKAQTILMNKKVANISSVTINDVPIAA